LLQQQSGFAFSVPQTQQEMQINLKKDAIVSSQDVGCGSLDVLRQTKNVSVLRYRRNPLKALRLDEKHYPAPVLAITTVGRWRYFGRRGKIEAGRDAVIVANANTTYGCAHVAGMCDENLVVSLSAGMLDEDDEVLFRNDVLRGDRRIHHLVYEASRPSTSESRLESLVFDAFESASISSFGGSRHAAQKRPDLAVMRATRFIEDHHAADLSLSSMAAAIGLSTFRFVHRFTQRQGVSPYAYLLRFRMTRARELLRHSQLEIRAIGEAVGFTDKSQFSRAFRRATGMSPSQFRAQYRRALY
jgi:AraC-like DNA-binding protein